MPRNGDAARNLPSYEYRTWLIADVATCKLDMHGMVVLEFEAGEEIVEDDPLDDEDSADKEEE